MTLVWHYATWASLPQIAAAGELMPRDDRGEGERPMVWFSANQQREPSATKWVRLDDGRARRLTPGEQAERFGSVRFGMSADDSRLLRWNDACRAAGITFTHRRKLEAAGRILGANPSYWFGVAQAVALIGLRFQVLGEQWGEADISEAARAWTTARG